MLEIYAFLLTFPVQILALSILFPLALIRYARTQAPVIPAERFEQLFPGIDYARSIERWVSRFRATSIAVAVLGLVLWGWLFNHMQHEGWNRRTVILLVCAYFGLQAFALILEAILGFSSYLKLLRQPPLEGRRKANLQRRGLFDFVPPAAVYLAVLAYFLFVAFMIHLQQRGMPAKTAFSMIACISLVYILDAAMLFVMLYRSRVFNPLETSENRGHWIGIQAKGTVYSCIFIVAFLALMCLLDVLNQNSWGPFVLSAFFVGCSISFFTSLAAAPRRQAVEPFDSHAAS